MSSDPKPPKRYRATQAEWNDIRDAFVDERCWVCDDVWTELHHAIARGQGGDDAIPNLIPVCRNCHARIEARDPVARSLIRWALLPSHYAYLRSKLGTQWEGWLSRNYPAGDVSAHLRGLRTRVEELTTTTNQELTTQELPSRYINPAANATDPAHV